MAELAVQTYVETRMVPVSQLKHFPGNANHGNVAKLRESLLENGQYRALVVRECDNGDLVIMAGNHTFDALVAEGATEVRCEIHHCDDKTAVKINIADNRYDLFKRIDQEAQLELLSYLDGDYAGTGYTEDDIQSMLTPPPPGPDDDEPGGLGEPVVAYNLVFDNEVQQNAWYTYLRWLRGQYPDMETNGERLHADIGSRGVG